jgi:hypothetical protein
MDWASWHLQNESDFIGGLRSLETGTVRGKKQLQHRKHSGLLSAGLPVVAFNSALEKMKNGQ